MTFALNNKLAEDTLLLGRWAGCQVLLMNDQRFPWLIVVPEVEGAVELYDLDPALEILTTINTLSQALANHTQAQKMNVAALGNMVPQLHIHIIARFADDAAWPNPVWGNGVVIPYADASSTVASYRSGLGISLT